MKKTISLLLSLLICALCAGCGAAPDFEPAALAEALESSGCFTDLLSEMDTAMAMELYGIEEGDVEACAVYLGTGATAEEIAVFRAKSAAAAKTIAEAFGARRDNQITAYKNYVPTEVPKLEDAIVKSSGSYAVYVTAADADGAQKIIDDYLK
jgi:hypothetical protein